MPMRLLLPHLWHKIHARRNAGNDEAAGAVQV
jgi:hypothetical protein